VGNAVADNAPLILLRDLGADGQRIVAVAITGGAPLVAINSARLMPQITLRDIQKMAHVALDQKGGPADGGSAYPT
jgi:hypothetical protein